MRLRRTLLKTRLLLWINIMPYFMTEAPKVCEGLTEELAEGIGRDFPIELSTDKQARYNLDLWERLAEGG
jgi:hypothetical protein